MLNCFLFTGLGIAIYTFFPSAREFKQGGLKDIYESIPYFANLFRYAYTTQLFGYLAIPLFFRSLKNGFSKDSFFWLLASMSSLIAGVAFFSRSNMVSFSCVFAFFYMHQSRYIEAKLKETIKKLVKVGSVCTIIVFLTMSYNRFSTMDYLEERIPKEAVVHDITTYYLLYYAGQGFPYGLNSMEQYTSEKCQNGSTFLYNTYQILGFFNIIKWDAADAVENREKALGDMQDKFIGYTAESVYDLGYIGTIFLSLTYFLIVRKICSRNNNEIKKLLLASILIQIPMNSIYYNCLTGTLTTIMFFVALNLYYKFIHSK